MTPRVAVEAIRLPPPFELVRLRERGEAFAQACERAGALGAATILRTGRFDRIEFALVLEPDEALAQARRVFFLCMGAAAQALAGHVPPERPVSIGWPDSLFLDGHPLGGGRLGWPADCAGTATPDWLVFGLDLVAATLDDPDHVPMAMSLAEAGVDSVDPDAFVADFARALLAAFDRLAHDGFAAAARPYLDALDPGKAGTRVAIDAHGDLLVTGFGATAPERRAFLPALAQARWRAAIGEGA